MAALAGHARAMVPPVLDTAQTVKLMERKKNPRLADIVKSLEP
jgi:hypothetical protein